VHLLEPTQVECQLRRSATEARRASITAQPWVAAGRQQGLVQEAVRSQVVVGVSVAGVDQRDKAMTKFVLRVTVGSLILTTACITGSFPVSAQKVFPTAQAAVDDLIAGAKGGRQGFVDDIFGPLGRQLVSSGDPVRDKERLAEFLEAAAEKTKLEDKDSGTKLLIVGNREFPFPIPIKKSGDGWVFDPVAGQQEIRQRQIGHNELAAISACRAYISAQKDYIKDDRDGDRVLEFAQRIVSTPDRQDGLYWEPQSQADISPLAGALSDALRDISSGAKSYEGYVFRILTRQGQGAPGGAYNYVINDNMIGGHALIAYPLKWGETGVMSFICSHHGDIFEKNFGADTSRAVAKLKSYAPDTTWRLVERVVAR
jgi:hypothetical protein